MKNEAPASNQINTVLRPNGKKALIVYAHPNKASYTGSIKDTIVKNLEESGFECKTSDLYEMKFDPVASKKDFTEIANKSHFNLVMEQRSGKFVPELNSEIEKLLWCDYLIMVFPFWWSGMPAIMTGWIDRVLACGKAWDFRNTFENGLLKGKCGLVVTSVGSPDSFYQPGQMQRHSIKRRLAFVNVGTFEFCGMTALEPIHLHASGSKNPDDRSAELNTLAQSMKKLNSLPVMAPGDN